MLNKKFFLLIVAWILFSETSCSNTIDTTRLASKPVYGREARVISYILDNNHFRKISLNDSLSEVILTRYINELDNSKTYFLEADIKAFEKYKFLIDDSIRNENVKLAYDIYKVFKERYQERMNYVFQNLLNQPFDFSVNEYYETNREKEPWSKSTAELNEIWKKIIKSQVLSLKISGKKAEEIQDILNKRYKRFVKSIEQFNSEDVFSVFMNSITESYDPHTNYLSPKTSDLFKQSMKLSLEGIGAQLQTDNDFTKVVRIIPGGPADKSGLLNANDLIVGVAQGNDGEMIDVVGWRIDEVVKLIKGSKGTTVRLQIIPGKTGVGGPQQEISIVRDKVKLEDEEAKMKIVKFKEGNKIAKIGVITLPSFYLDFEAYQKGEKDYRSTTRDVKKLIVKLKKEGIEGLVMDLRNNGGGSLPEAVDLTGLFITEGPVVQIKDSSHKIDVLSDEDKSVTYNGPLVVLTNRFSASASEIFAGAIQDYKRGVIMGEPTYGKGTVQTVLSLKRFINDKEPIGELKFTFQKFYRVTGSSTQHKGVSPDIQLPTALDAEHYGESAMKNALSWDTIKPTSFTRTNDINKKTIQDLQKSFEHRMKVDTTLIKYSSDVEKLKHNLTHTKISLSEEIRKKEIDSAEIDKDTDQINNKTPIQEEEVVSDLTKMNDAFLRQGILTLSQLIKK